MNFTSFQSGAYGDARGRAALDALVGTGTSSVALTPTWYMDSAGATTIAPDPRKTPTDDALLAAAGAARVRGLSVVIKPHVDVRDGTFRGDTEPASLDAWFASYRREVVHYADLARDAHATLLVVGTELASTTSDTARWRQLILVARAHFPGRLTYAANQLDEASQIGFWPQLDAIGVDAYMPLADSGSPPTLRGLVDAWQPYLAELAQLSATNGRRVLFTELGYQPVAGAHLSPNGTTGPRDDREQALAYEAAMRALAPQPWFDGIYWWNWEADAGSHASLPPSFSPHGHLAEAVLRRFNGPPVSGGGKGIGPSTAATDQSTPPKKGSAMLLWIVAAALFGPMLLALAAYACVTVAARADRQAAHLATSPSAVAATSRRARETAERTKRMVALEGIDTRLMELALDAYETSGVDRVAIFLRDARDPRATVAAVSVGVPADLVGQRFASDEGLAGQALTTGRAVSVADYQSLRKPLRHPAVQGIHASASIPLVNEGAVIGALSVGTTDRQRRLTPNDLGALYPGPVVIATSDRA